ncbi:MAG TPA: hypothetical protein VIS06_17840, partial [Mycobacteriales bacterium]
RIGAAIGAQGRSVRESTPPRPTSPPDHPGRGDQSVVPAVGTVVDISSARRRGRRRVRAAGWAAATTVLLGGIGVGANTMLGSGDTPAGGTDTVTVSTLADPSGDPNGDTRPGLGQFGQQGKPAESGEPTTPPQHGLTPNHQKVPSYTRDDIGARLDSILAQASCDTAASCPVASAGAMSDSARRARCVSALDSTEGVPGNPRAVQFALFDGSPAFVFVFDGDRVLVVGSDCGQAATPEVLFHGR